MEFRLKLADLGIEEVQRQIESGQLSGVAAAEAKVWIREQQRKEAEERPKEVREAELLKLTRRQDRKTTWILILTALLVVLTIAILVGC